MRNERRLFDTNQSDTKIVSFLTPKFSSFEPEIAAIGYDFRYGSPPNRFSHSTRTRQIVSLFRLSTFCMIVLKPCHCAVAPGGNGTWQRQDQRFYSSCPFDKLDTCFRRAFSSMSDPNGEMASCEDFERLSSCFRYINCSQKESSEIGARVFLAMKRVRLPKEFFSALLTRWRLRCSLECTDYEPDECRRSMLPKERDTDYALMMELQSLKMQMALMTDGSKTEKCHNFRKAMLRWHVFRVDKCSNGDSSCFCRKEEKVLRSVCAVQCDKLHLANNIAGSIIGNGFYVFGFNFFIFLVFIL